MRPARPAHKPGAEAARAAPGPASLPAEVDVAVVGGGISGVAAAHHLQRAGRSFIVLEARERLGGTWDLFRYPGVRSDSDMHTLGFPFRPWTGTHAIADGPEIRRYVVETAREFGLERHVRFGCRVLAARWSSQAQRWTLELAGGERVRCRFLFGCTGYYSYERPYTPPLPGLERFRGPVIHPQHWPEDLEVAGRRVVVIGSGATAVTLVPALAARGAQVTMLQRSPSYIVSLPREDPLARRLIAWLPGGLGHRAVRWKNVLLTLGTFKVSRRAPRLMRRLLIGGVARALPEGYDVERHFHPRYDPWDERLCLVPDGDLFQALRTGRAEVVTDQIAAVGQDGVRLCSGRELQAEILVTATGLTLQLLGGIELSVDGAPVQAAGRLTLRGLMIAGVPNLAVSFGYTNASWTLKCELICRCGCSITWTPAAWAWRRPPRRPASGRGRPSSI